MPPLLSPFVSEGDSDNKSSVGSNESHLFPDNNSEGDDADMWADHPTTRNPNSNSNRISTRNSSENLPRGQPDYLPKDNPAAVPSPTTCPSGNTIPPISPTTPPINHPATPVPPELPDRFGHGSYGKSWILRKKGTYYCSNGSQQVPSGIKEPFLCKKKLKHRQRMAKRRNEGDQMLLSMEDKEIPTVEQLLACPLSRFIHFVANNCGYAGSRTELIANWV